MKNNIISAFGAFLCISALAYLNSFDESNLWLIPPFGASMVLVMAAHESPLAHPKNILFGHILSALSGVVVYSVLGFSFLSVGLGVGHKKQLQLQACFSTPALRTDFITPAALVSAGALSHDCYNNHYD